MLVDLQFEYAKNAHSEELNSVLYIHKQWLRATDRIHATPTENHRKPHLQTSRKVPELELEELDARKQIQKTNSPESRDENPIALAMFPAPMKPTL